MSFLGSLRRTGPVLRLPIRRAALENRKNRARWPVTHCVRLAPLAPSTCPGKPELVNRRPAVTFGTPLHMQSDYRSESKAVVGNSSGRADPTAAPKSRKRSLMDGVSETENRPQTERAGQSRVMADASVDRAPSKQQTPTARNASGNIRLRLRLRLAFAAHS